MPGNGAWACSERLRENLAKRQAEASRDGRIHEMLMSCPPVMRRERGATMADSLGNWQRKKTREKGRMLCRLQRDKSTPFARRAPGFTCGLGAGPAFLTGSRARRRETAVDGSLRPSSVCHAPPTRPSYVIDCSRPCRRHGAISPRCIAIVGAGRAWF